MEGMLAVFNTSLNNRFRSGLAIRHSKLLSFLDKASKEFGAGSQVETHKLKAADFEIASDSRWLLISAALTLPTIFHQRNIISSISPTGEDKLNELFTVGAGFAIDIPDSIDAEGLTDDEFSIILESFLNFGIRKTILNLDMEAAKKDLREFRNKILDILPMPVSEVFFDNASGKEKVKNEHDKTEHERCLNFYLSEVSSFKRSYIKYIGPDLCSALQAMCDPTESLSSHQLASFSALFESWECLSLFNDLASLRICGGYSDERRFFQENINSLTPRISKRGAIIINSMLGIGQYSNIPRPRDKRLLTMHIWHCLRVGYFISISDTRSLSNAIIDAFCFDKALVGFFDWDAIYSIIRSYQGDVDANLTFVVYLMNDDIVRRRFPYVAFAMGKGALVSDLTTLIGRAKRNVAITSLLGKLKPLQKRGQEAAQALTLAILERSTVERISSALIGQRMFWPKSLPPVDATRVSVVRIQMIGRAGELGLIEDDLVDTLFDQEMVLFRLAYFQGRMRGGRVRVLWKEFDGKIAAIIKETIPAWDSLEQDLPKFVLSEDLIDRVARFLANRITDFILHESKLGLNQSLSNNLRHGIVLPRFLRAFEDAVQTVTPKGKLFPTFESRLSRTSFAVSSDQILKFRDYLSENIKEFVNGKLVVLPGSDFDRAFRAALTESLKKNLFNPRKKVNQKKVHAAIRVTSRRRISTFLATAGTFLDKDVRRDIFKKMSDLRLSQKANKGHTLNSFLDSLETNLHDAFDEVVRWTHLAEENGEAIPFKIQEIVNLNLLSSSLTAWDKLQVTTNTYAKKSDVNYSEQDFRVSGKYLEMFQAIIHNLLSNAFKYSGEGLKTKIQISVYLSEKQFVVRCINSISQDKLKNIVKSYPLTISLATSTEIGNAGSDNLSGFQKIKQAVEKEFKRSPRINVPPISEQSPRFLVDIIIPFEGSIIA